MLEAIACGCPVAAFPVTGPIDVVTHGVNSVLDEDLRSTCLRALALDRARVRASALRHQWRAIAEVLLSILVPVVPTPVTRSSGTSAPIAGTAR